MTKFDGVTPALNRALEKRGYDMLTPVQEAVLAPELGDADLLVSAQTGSGKTVAFGVNIAPTLLGDKERFAAGGAPLALIVTPTRELALQVKREMEWLYAEAGASVVSCVGGMDMREERRALGRGAHIVVGTPGRLVDHLKRKSLLMHDLKAVVLDEADEMLDLGFREDLEFILAAAPDERRTLMFSATVPRSIASLAKKYQQDAVRVNTAAEQKQHLDIEYRALGVASYERENAIINVLRFYEAKNAIVFCATRATVNHLTSRFNNRGFSVVALSGELSQKERTYALQSMRDGRARVCVATDVAARGIDLPELDLVIHADLPRNADTLLHRSGRTGRAGRKGTSVLIVPNNARKKAERLLGNAKIKAAWAKAPSADDVIARDDDRLINDPVLSEEVHETERELTDALLAKYSAEQIAAAFIRANRAGKSAPEELSNTPELEKPQKEAKQKRREEFENGVWIALSVGRSKSAEPRWLIPMLCKAGGIAKKDIGAIKVHQKETHVEISDAAIERFLEKVGPEAKLEKSIYISRIDAPAELEKETPANSYKKRKPYKGKKAYSERKPGKGKKPVGKKHAGGKFTPKTKPGGAKKPKQKKRA